MAHTSAPNDAPLAVVVLAAGGGTRMKSKTPKPLHTIGGRTLLGHVLAAAGPLGAQHTLVVVGHGRDEVAASFADTDARPVVQDVQKGTGHAARLALDAVPDFDGAVLVLYGDTPLLTTESLAALVEEHRANGALATILTAAAPDPTGYGRVIRDETGSVSRIVEHRDATEVERSVHEINTGVGVFQAAPLRTALAKLRDDNAAGESYLTDVIGGFVSEGGRVAAVIGDLDETAGINDRAQLAEAGRLLRDRVVRHWMREGVCVVDPATTWIDVTVELAPDVVLHPNVQLHGSTVVSEGAAIGPDCTLRDTQVGSGAVVVRAQAEGAQIGPEAHVGPYAYLRPGAVLGRRSKVGTYVEVKASEIGDESKVPHLTYVGDATIGRDTNIGASSVFANYDGVHKSRSEIGDHVRTGSDNMFVAPVRVGDGAYTGAGAVIREDVPPGALAVSAGAKQRVIEGWTERKRPGTPSAAAAAAARQNQARDGRSGDDGERE